MKLSTRNLAGIALALMLCLPLPGRAATFQTQLVFSAGAANAGQAAALRVTVRDNAGTVLTAATNTPNGSAAFAESGIVPGAYSAPYLVDTTKLPITVEFTLGAGQPAAMAVIGNERAAEAADGYTPALPGSLTAGLAGDQKAGQAVTLPALPAVTLAPAQAFNNTGQTTAPAWLGVSSVLLPGDHTAIASDVQAGLTAQGWTTALVTQLAAQVARIYGAEWGTITQTSTGYTVAMPAGALTIPAPGAVIGTVAPSYDTANKLTNQTKTVN